MAVVLFVATCLSTWLVGGPAFSLALMTYLVDNDKADKLHYMKATMTQKAKRVNRQRNESIDVRDFEDISIRFPGDVYILATWMAMSDVAKSTPRCQSHTTLHGLAQSFAMLHGTDYSNPLNIEDVIAVFRKHGISGNPTLRLETTQEKGTTLPIKLSTGAIHEGERVAPISDRESSPPAQ